jgi:hypothetical protein
MAFLPATRRCRLLVIYCALHTLWTGIDSQILLLASSGDEPPLCQSSLPSQEDRDDDDYVLDLTGKSASRHGLLRKSPLPSPRLNRQIADTIPCFVMSCHRQLPTTHRCEDNNRNGLGVPLLC